MKKGNVFLIIIIIVLAVSAVVLLLTTRAAKNTVSDQTTTQLDKQQAQETKKIIDESKTVTLSDTGFDPKEITVTTGTRIIWSNKSNTKASVNSDPFPVNSYWKFLNLGAFNNGEYLTLIFDTPGTYTYHNQYKPDQTGTVIVK